MSLDAEHLLVDCGTRTLDMALEPVQRHKELEPGLDSIVKRKYEEQGMGIGTAERRLGTWTRSLDAEHLLVDCGTRTLSMSLEPVPRHKDLEPGLHSIVKRKSMSITAVL